LITTTVTPAAGLPSEEETFPVNVPVEDCAKNAEGQPAMISAANQRVSFVKLDDMDGSLTDGQEQLLSVLFSTDLKESQI
jgi:hypothetical protein